MILKKVKLAPFILLSSVIFTFLAAVVDLARISLRHDNSGRVRMDNENLTNTLETVREILSSVASGLRFLYFWAFVSQPPLCEQGSGSFLRLHSGSWLHWGLTGTVLRWSTLFASLSIFVLQILWRTVRPLHRFGPVYNVESALEIGASGVYMIKLLLNSMIVEEDCRRETLWQYTAALFALFINLGVGVGNILEFRFSETSLGRLLLATGLYILIVSSMVFSFYTRPPAPPPLPNLRDKRASSFRGLHVSFYDADLGLVGEDIANPTSRSPSQRPSSWLSWNAPQRRSSQIGPSYEDRRRARRSESEEAERGGVSPSSKQGTSDITQPSSVNLSITDPITRGISEDFSSSPITRLPADVVYDSGKSSNPRAAAMTTSPDSPTLGDGIGAAQQINRPFLRPQQHSDGSLTSSQGSGFEILLREQNELERSIAVLRAMSIPGGNGKEQKAKTSNAVSDPPERRKLRDSSTTTAYGPTSASGRSDFSLSVFPEPPEIPRVTEKPRTYQSQSPSTLARTPTQRTFNIGEQGFPVSTGEGDDIMAFDRRTESAGTHYDVTSFIGDLTSPINRASATQIAMYLKDSDTDSEAGSADLATIVTVERKPSNGVISRPHLVEKTSLASELSLVQRPPSPRSRANSVRGGTVTRQPSSRPDRGTPPPPVGFARVPPSRPMTPAGRVVGLPSRPKLDVSPRGDQ